MKNQLEWIMKHLAFTMDQSLMLSQSPDLKCRESSAGLAGAALLRVTPLQRDQQVPQPFLWAVPLTEGCFP